MCDLKVTHTVEPLSNRHIGGKDFVLCRGVVLFQRLKNTTTISWCPEMCLLLRGCLFFRGSSISEVPLYMKVFMATIISVATSTIPPTSVYIIWKKKTHRHLLVLL